MGAVIVLTVLTVLIIELLHAKVMNGMKIFPEHIKDLNYMTREEIKCLNVNSVNLSLDRMVFWDFPGSAVYIVFYHNYWPVKSQIITRNLFLDVISAD